jgi:hypothetical protein
MEGSQRSVPGNQWVISPDFIDSEEFTIATVSILTAIGLGLPLTLICFRHFDRGFIDVACLYGLFAVVVFGISGWKLYASVQRARFRFARDAASPNS